MAEQTETAITLPITPGKIQRAVEHIVEQTFPRPRQELCIPVGEMERRLSELVGEAVQVAYDDAAGIRSDAGDHHAQPHWDYGGDQHVNKAAWLAKADTILAVIAGKGV